MFKNYYQVRDWVEEFIPLVYGKEELGLVRIENLLEKLGNPHKKFKSIHVAGTSGKGSTAYYTARLLAENFKFPFLLETRSRRAISNFKFKVGLHVSPHLVDIRERMRIFQSQVARDQSLGKKDLKTGGGRLMTFKEEEELMPMGRFLKLFGEIKPVVEKIKKETPDLTPSYFEILVAASFKYFAEQKVDYAVVEVGLGGRLDATNVLMPEVSVITNIGLDHTEILGKTIEKIAYEKAGIIKKGVPVVTAAEGKGLFVIEEVVKKKGSTLHKINTQEYKSVLTGLSNLGGIKNTILALKTLEVLLLRECATTKQSLEKDSSTSSQNDILRRLRLTKEEIDKIFSRKFPGRFEEIEEGVILDGAHNPDKIKALINFIREFSILNSQFSIILVVAFKRGKNWKKMLDLLIKSLPVKTVIATQFYATTDTGPTPSMRLRGVNKFSAVEPEEISSYLNTKYKILNAKYFNNSQEAVYEAIREIYSSRERLKRANREVSAKTTIRNSSEKLPLRSNSNIVLVTGSLYLVGEVRTMWHLPSF